MTADSRKGFDLFRFFSSLGKRDAAGRVDGQAVAAAYHGALSQTVNEVHAHATL